MNKKLPLFILLFLSLYMQAQERIGIAFIPITYDENVVSSTDAMLIQQTVLNSFVSGRKFSVVDREKLDAIQDEKKLQQTESFMDSKSSITDGISKGASYLIATNILSLRHSEIKKGWESMLQLQVKVLDVSTGQILATESVSSAYVEPTDLILNARKEYASKDEIKAFESHEENLSAVQAHQEDAFIWALKRLDVSIRKFSDSNFPVSLDLVNWSSKKNEQFTISGGSGIGIVPGQMLDVMEVMSVTINGETKERHIKIADACVIRVDDDNFSEALILSSDKKTFKNAIKNGSQLKILTK